VGLLRHRTVPDIHPKKLPKTPSILHLNESLATGKFVGDGKNIFLPIFRIHDADKLILRMSYKLDKHPIHLHKGLAKELLTVSKAQSFP
jgi:hypothetical protein